MDAVPSSRRFVQSLRENLNREHVAALESCLDCGQCGSACAWYLATGNPQLHPRMKTAFLQRIQRRGHFRSVDRGAASGFATSGPSHHHRHHRHGIPGPDWYASMGPFPPCAPGAVAGGNLPVHPLAPRAVEPAGLVVRLASADPARHRLIRTGPTRGFRNKKCPASRAAWLLGVCTTARFGQVGEGMEIL